MEETVSEGAPKPEAVDTPKQQTVIAQYGAFRDYLLRDLPESEHREEALTFLGNSFEAAYLAAAV